MRSKLLGCTVVAFLAIGCSQKGVVVEKRLKPSPFAYSTGIDAIYSFLLRDEQGRVHSQMVTPEVFQRYEVGEYFDDQQAGPPRREGFSKDSAAVSDSKDVKPVHHRATRRKRQASNASAHKMKHRHLRAVVQTREEQSQIAGAVMRREEPHSLDIHP